MSGHSDLACSLRVRGSSVLTEIIPGLVVVARSEWDTLPATAVGAAALCEDTHRDFPRRLFFPMLPVDHRLGAHPHVAMAAHISERLGTATLTRLSAPGGEPGDQSAFLAMHMNSDWCGVTLIDNPHTGSVDVRVIDRLSPRLFAK